MRACIQSCMATMVVQFRVPEEEGRWLREHGENPNAFAKQAFERWLRRKRAEESFEALRGHRVRLPKSPADIMREERESH